jgi:hypothetical protein
MKKIAFLFLVIDDINFPNIWDFYFRNFEDKINIYIHPKNPNKTKWHKECIIRDLRETSWGHIVDAYRALFTEALKDKDNVKFITVSESCVPIKPFDVMYHDIMYNKNESFVKILPIKSYDWQTRINDKIIDTVGENKLIKHYARMCLSRTHIEQLLASKTKLDLFIRTHVGDEFFLSSITPLSNINNFAVTFDDWEFVEKQKKDIKNIIKQLYIEQETYKNIDNTSKILNLKSQHDEIAKNPKTITKVTNDDLHNMETTKSYFYRKFSKKSNIENYIYEFIAIE